MNNTMDWALAALSMGVLSSAHCAAMCGPIVLSIPWKNKAYSTMLVYHLGRTTTYFILGFIVSYVGSAFQLTINHFWIAIIGGLVIITLNLPWNKWGLSIDMPWIQTLSKTVKKWTKHQSLQQRFFLGMLNGILPCGMVYIALAVAFSLHNPFSGAFFMLLFGISTSPALLFIQQIKAWISKIPFFQKEKTVRYSLMVLGLLIIMRGAGLGIPYLSPKNIASPAGNNKPACCHTN